MQKDKKEHFPKNNGLFHKTIMLINHGKMMNQGKVMKMSTLTNINKVIKMSTLQLKQFFFHYVKKLNFNLKMITLYTQKQKLYSRIKYKDINLIIVV